MNNSNEMIGKLICLDKSKRVGMVIAQVGDHANNLVYTILTCEGTIKYHYKWQTKEF
jgi:hypothetical protein